jgi:hypothetical protein
MKRSLGMIIVVVGFLIAGVVAFNKYKSKVVEAEKTSSFDRIQKLYFERVAWIRANPDERVYRDEVQTFFRWYFKEINEHLNRFGGAREFDSYLKELETRKLTDQQLTERKRHYDYTKAVFDQFRSGNYSPLYTATDKGLRLDILSADVKMEAGQPRIRMPIVLWGASRELREEGKLKKMVTSSTFNVAWKLFDEKGKLYGEMSAQGDPASKIDHPEIFIPEFPGMIVLGHFDWDQLPSDVARVEIAITVSSRAPSGGEALANFDWKLDTPSDWKLRSGEEWKGAQESVRPEEEIAPSARR